MLQPMSPATTALSVAAAHQHAAAPAWAAYLDQDEEDSQQQQQPTTQLQQGCGRRQHAGRGMGPTGAAAAAAAAAPGRQAAGLAMAAHGRGGGSVAGGSDPSWWPRDQPVWSKRAPPPADGAGAQGGWQQPNTPAAAAAAAAAAAHDTRSEFAAGMGALQQARSRWKADAVGGSVLTAGAGIAASFGAGGPWPVAPAAAASGTSVQQLGVPLPAADTDVLGVPGYGAWPPGCEAPEATRQLPGSPHLTPSACSAMAPPPRLQPQQPRQEGDYDLDAMYEDAFGFL